MLLHSIMLIVWKSIHLALTQFSPLWLVFEDDFGIMVWMNVSYLDSDCLAVGCSMGFRLHNYFFNDVLWFPPGENQVLLRQDEQLSCKVDVFNYNLDLIYIPSFRNSKTWDAEPKGKIPQVWRAGGAQGPWLSGVCCGWAVLALLCFTLILTAVLEERFWLSHFTDGDRGPAE